MGATNCSTLRLDSSMSALDGNVASVVLCGLGEGCRKGMLFTQAPEGSSAVRTIELKVPPAQCERDHCIKFQFFNPDGTEGYSGSIERGKTNTTFLLKDIVKSDTLRLDHDAEWLVKVKVWFKDGDVDVERTMMGWAFLRVNVISPEYEFLSCEDPEAGWDLEHAPGCDIYFSSRFRSSICGDCTP